MKSRFVLIPISLLTAATLVASSVYLAVSLPAQYLTERWVQAWVGLDVAMALAALAIAIGFAQSRRFVGPLASTLATLLAADAWFDCMTANATDITQSLMLLFAEVPLAAFFAAVGYKCTASPQKS